MLDQSGFNLSSGETVSRNVNNVINTATDPVVSIIVTGSTITSEVVPLVDIQVCLHVALVGTPDGTGHARPGLPKGKHTLDLVAGNLLARDRVDDSRVNTEEWQGSTTRLGGGDTTQRGDDVGASLGLPVGLPAS